MSSENEYLLKSVHDEYAQRMEDEDKRQNHRIECLEKALEQIVNLTASIERLATNMENMAKEQQDQGDRIKVIEERDGEKLRSIASHVTFSIITLVLGYLASKLGL